MTDSNLEAYKKGLEARAAKERQTREKIGDLAAGAAIYDPAKDGPMTIKDIGEAGNRMAAPSESEEKPAFKESTIAGLKAMADAAQSAHNQEAAAKASSEGWTPIPVEDAFVKEADPTADTVAAPKHMPVVAADPNEPIDNLELDRMLGLSEIDSINNMEERKAVEAKLEPMSLARGLASGCFMQEVPINEALTITYRSYSPTEHRAIRKLLWDWCDKDPTIENMSSDIFGNMLLAASIHSINNVELASHMNGHGFKATFDDMAFKNKFDLISAYPIQILHSLGVHGQWFDQRVRELLKVSSLKSG